MNKIMNKNILIILVLIMLISVQVSAEKGHMMLLTVGERGNETFGGTADVYLEIRPGSGRIFLDSFPLTKLDTQISTRFAKEVACDFLEEDCSDKDFFYTIRAKSSVVGGPSAGAALTVLTIAVLEDKDLNESVIMTGTINSGGIVGPVAGIAEKVDAAKDAQFKKVLIPKRSIMPNESDAYNSNGTMKNITLVYSDSFQLNGIEVIPISTIEDALFQFTGVEYPDYSYNLTVPEDYLKIMGEVSLDICSRAEFIIPLISSETKKDELKRYNLSLDYLKKANESITKRDYYSAASFCFNANKELRTLEYEEYSKEELLLVITSAKQDVVRMLDDVNKKELLTMSDLETSMVVKERLFEARDILSQNESDVIDQLPYVVERIYSAKVWSKFFAYPGKQVSLDKDHLSMACIAKISEAEEQLNYLELIFGEHDQFRKELGDVKKIYDTGDYSFCLFKASRTKSEVSAILTSLSIPDEKFQELLDDQLKLARIQINKQENNFPIIGYSYYDYASSLRESRPELALIFSEYASEFSNLDMYFPKEKKFKIRFNIEQTGAFLIGFSMGLLFVIVVLSIYAMVEKRRKKRKMAKIDMKPKFVKKRK